MASWRKTCDSTVGLGYTFWLIFGAQLVMINPKGPSLGGFHVCFPGWVGKEYWKNWLLVITTALYRWRRSMEIYFKDFEPHEWGTMCIGQQQNSCQWWHLSLESHFLRIWSLSQHYCLRLFWWKYTVDCTGPCSRFRLDFGARFLSLHI